MSPLRRRTRPSREGNRSSMNPRITGDLLCYLGGRKEEGCLRYLIGLVCDARTAFQNWGSGGASMGWVSIVVCSSGEKPFWASSNSKKRRCRQGRQWQNGQGAAVVRGPITTLST